MRHPPLLALPLLTACHTPAPPPALPERLTITEPFTLQDYTFVRVPGDPARGIDPFYLQTTEVTWGQMLAWASASDLPEKERFEAVV